MYAYMHACLHVCMYLCMYACTYVRMYICYVCYLCYTVHVCMHVFILCSYMYIRTSTCMFIYICTTYGHKPFYYENVRTPLMTPPPTTMQKSYSSPCGFTPNHFPLPSLPSLYRLRFSTFQALCHCRRSATFHDRLHFMFLAHGKNNK